MRSMIRNVAASKWGFFAMTDDDPPERNAMQKFYCIYGETMTAWTSLETALFHWFMYSTKMDEAIARAVFYSARNFTGRRDMLIAALPYAPLSELEMEFIKAALKRVRRYAEFRNKAIHREPILDARRESPTWLQMILVEGSSIETNPDAITQKQLGIATKNFLDLRTMLETILPSQRSESASVELYLRLVRELPNEACSKERAPIQPQKKSPPQPPEA